MKSPSKGAIQTGEQVMPNKTIYVSETDIPVFDKAQQMAGGNLSSAIAQALRRYVEDEEMQEQRFEEISVDVGRVYRVHKKFIRESSVEKRFMGKAIISWRTRDPEDPRSESYDVYKTPKGRFVVYSRIGPNDNYEGDDEEEDPTSESRLDVYDSLEAMHAGLPQELYEATVEAAAAIAADGELLDI
jgi:EXLDI family protein